MPTGPFSRQTWQGIESLPGQLFNNLGRLGSYLSSEKAAQDYSNLLLGIKPAKAGRLPDKSVPMTEAERQRQIEAIRAFEVAPAAVASATAAERAYQQEKSRVAQLAAQDELAKKYNVADLTKAYNTASTPEEKEKIGLQIWATTNPQLAAKLKPGQLGYQETQAVAAAQSPLGGAMQAVGDMQYTDKISFGAVPATDFGIGLQTPLTGFQVPSIPQVGVAEAFKGTTPGGVSFTEAAELFKPEALSQTQQALLKQAFEKGLKK